MGYKRKTVDEYDIEGDFGAGWEIVTCEENLREASRAKREYQLNCPGIPIRIKKRRVPAPELITT